MVDKINAAQGGSTIPKLGPTAEEFKQKALDELKNNAIKLSPQPDLKKAEETFTRTDARDKEIAKKTQEQKEKSYMTTAQYNVPQDVRNEIKHIKPHVYEDKTKLYKLKNGNIFIVSNNYGSESDSALYKNNFETIILYRKITGQIVGPNYNIGSTIQTPNYSVNYDKSGKLFYIADNKRNKVTYFRGDSKDKCTNEDKKFLKTLNAKSYVETFDYTKKTK